MSEDNTHSIRIGEYKLPVRIGKLKLFDVASHIVISAHDETGRQIWEINGLATDKNGNPIPIGMPWDNTDRIKGYLDTVPRMGGFVENQVSIVTGTPEEIEAFKGRAQEVIERVNSRNLHYKLDTQNSNSFAGTILKSFGIPPQELLNSKKHSFEKPVPGFIRDLLEDADGYSEEIERGPLTNEVLPSNRKNSLDFGKTPVPEAKPMGAERSGGSFPRRALPDTGAELRSDVRNDRANMSGNIAPGFNSRPQTLSRKSGQMSAGHDRRTNPFDLKNQNLKRQSELIEHEPVLAKRMILAAGRNPKLFQL